MSRHFTQPPRDQRNATAKPCKSTTDTATANTWPTTPSSPPSSGATTKTPKCAPFTATSTKSPIFTTKPLESSPDHGCYISPTRTPHHSLAHHGALCALWRTHRHCPQRVHRPRRAGDGVIIPRQIAISHGHVAAFCTLVICQHRSQNLLAQSGTFRHRTAGHLQHVLDRGRYSPRRLGGLLDEHNGRTHLLCVT